MNIVKKALKKGKITIGSWITIGHTVVAEIMANAGFDWIVVDMEHSVITIDVAQQLIQIIEGCGVVPLVRVGENNPNLIKRVMDAGAYGVVIPMINTKEHAESAVKAVKYPPIGTRGVGLARAQRYGFNFDEYAATINKESLVIVQIEHIDAVNNLDSILSVEGIDGCIIGPYDLSGSLGMPGNFNHPDIFGALKRVEEVCKEKRVALGMHIIQPDHKLVVKKVSEGYSFLAFSLDILFLGTICREEMARLRRELNG